MVFSADARVRQVRRFHRFFSLLVLLSFVLLLFVFNPSQAHALTYVSGTISQNTTWTTAGSPYVLTSDVTVSTGVTLTVQEGVVVKPQSATTSLNIYGSLNATGAIFTSFKDDSYGGDTNGDGNSTLPAPGDWRQININSSSPSALSGCIIQFGGSSYQQLSIGGTGAHNLAGSTISKSFTSGLVLNTSTASISGSTFSDNGGDGLNASSVSLANLYSNTFTSNNGYAVIFAAISGPNVHSNTYSGNKVNGMYLSGDVTQNTTWPASNSPYVIQGTHGGQIGNKWLQVNSGSTLTIESGSVVKFFIRPEGVSHNTDNTLEVYGGLNASGVTFTSFKDDTYAGDTNGDGFASSPQPGDWKSISISSVTEASTLNSCIIKFGGSFSNPEVYFGGTSAKSISNSTISNSQSQGIAVGTDAVSISGSTISDNGGDGLNAANQSLAALYSNSFTGNNGYAVIFSTIAGPNVYGNTYSGNKVNGMYLSGDVAQNTTWLASNSPYIIQGTHGGLIGNKWLQINTGATLTIDPGTVVKFFIRPLGVSHNTDNKLLVNGALETNGVVFTSFNDDNYGGDSNGDGPLTSPQPGDWSVIEFISTSTTSTLNACIVRYGGSYSGAEIYSNSSSGNPLNITGSAISFSQTSGIAINNPNIPSIHNNDIYANYSFGIDNNTTLRDLSNNWWGGTGGPKPYGTGNGIDGNAIVDPWSDVPFTQAGAEAQAMGTDTWCGAYGEPVNTSTGAFYYSHTDISIPTRGLPLEFARTYNANDPNDGPLGYGWSYSAQLSANPRASGDVVILRGDGRRDTFIKNPDGSFTAPAGRHDTLTKNPDGTYRLTTNEQVVYNFGATNRLASMVSETGQTTTFTYDGNKRLTTITEPAGRTLTFTYTPENRIDEITDPQDNTVSFIYSPEGNLTQVTDQNGGITLYGYDGYHHMTSITDPNSHAFVNNVYDASGRVAEQRDAEGNLLTFAYDPANRRSTMTQVMDPNDPSKNQVTVHEYDASLRLTREIDPYGKETIYTYDAAGNRDSVTDRRGVTTKSFFDPYGNLTDLYKAYGHPEQQHTHVTYNAKNHPLVMTDSRGYSTSYSYDASGTYLQQISYPQVSNYDGTFSAFTESFTYNSDGTLATTTDKNSDTSAFAYDSYGGIDTITQNTNRPPADQVTLGYDIDSLGRKTRFIDGNGHETTYEYSPIGDLRFVRTTVTNPETQLPQDIVTEYQYDGNGNKTLMIDPEGKTTSFAYTGMDNLRLITDARLNTIEHTYDAAYNRTATKDKNGNWTHFGFDKNNRMVSLTDAEDNTTSFLLDEEGNRTAETDPLGRTVTSTYDALGRLTSVTEPDEGGLERTTTYAYDAADNLISTTDPANHTFTSSYDELGRIKSSTDALAGSVYSKYDGAGNRIKSRDQRGFETSFGFSPNDWLKTVTDPGSFVTAYDYDFSGNMTRQTDAEGRVTLYAYDELGRLTNEKVDAGSGSYLLEKSYLYDKAGNLVKDTTGEGAIAYAYDGVYNLTGITDRQGATYAFTYDAAGNQLTATDAGAARTVTFAYSPRGMLAAATDAHGATESFTYDAVGNLAQRDDAVAGQNFTTTFTHTPRNQVKSVSRGASTATFTFDATGNLAGKSYPNGVNTTFGYDANGRLTSQTALKGSQTLESYTQTYDPAGNVTSLSELGLGTSEFAYDSLNRLYYENIAGYGSTGYSYDRAGNRTASFLPGVGLTIFSYNQANQLTRSVNGATITDYSYDQNGAVSQETSGSDTTNYAYNGLDKLTQVTTPATTVGYAYDALGRRIERIQGAATKKTHLSGASDLADYETDQTGALGASLMRGPDGLFLYTAFFGGQTYQGYQHFNPHGDTALITDGTGAQVYSARYDSFGNNISGGGLGYGYAGKWQRDTDPATGSIRMGVREYDPGAGRFVSVDPLRGNAMKPQTRNRYEYGLNNPARFYDLDGLFPGENQLDWLDEKASEFKDLMNQPPFDFFTGAALHPAEIDNDIVNFIAHDELVNMALGTSIGGLGAFGYSTEMTSFYGGLKLPLKGLKGVRGNQCAVSKWGSKETLGRHYADHGADFGAKNANDYSRMADEFFVRAQSENLPTKIDANGIIRVYEPSTNTFAAYNADGTTKTFFKPTGGINYWNQQSGSFPWTP